MPADAWITTAALLIAIIVMATDRASTVVAMGGTVVALLFGGVLDVDQALTGLASEGPATIAALYVLAGAAATTGALGRLADGVLTPGGGRSSVARLAGSTAVISSCVPNTPLVAVLAPRVMRWARRTGTAPSSLLMPLSFASVLGGVVTVIGTSTNLVVSDVLEQSGRSALGVFEITPVGLPVAIVGVVTLSLLAPWLLPAHRAGEAVEVAARRFQVVMQVVHGSPLAGRTVEEAGLRNLAGVFLVAIERGGHVLAVERGTMLAGGDVCVFVGDVAQVMDLHDVDGLRSAEHPHISVAAGRDRRLYEAVIGDRSDLAGSTLKQEGFRSRYGAAVLAIHRAAGELTGKLGTIELRSGDVLLVLGGPEFDATWREHHDFALVAAADEPPPPRRDRALLVSLSFVAMVALAATDALSLLEAALAAAIVVIVGGAISTAEAGRAVNLDVVLTIAASVSVGVAVQTSGLAAEVANAVVDVGSPMGARGQLVAILIATMILTELLSNNAAAAVMVPVALVVADEIGADPRAFAIAVLIGASCSFLSPIGYQTNLMVYSLGGYRFVDFARLGLPLTLVTAVVTPIAIWVAFP
jgi:di/tricarboxylate transporter